MTKSLLEQIDERLAVCTKATPKPWVAYCDSDDVFDHCVHAEGHGDVIRDNIDSPDGEFIAASRNQREGELAALRVAVKALLTMGCNIPHCGEVSDYSKVECDTCHTLAQITKLMGE